MVHFHHNGTCFLTNFSDSHEYLSIPTSILHGYDFSYQGLLGIWEGFQPLISQKPDTAPTFELPSYHHHDRRTSRHNASTDEGNGSFQAALAELANRRIADRPWKPMVPTMRALQRQIALHLCGWSLRDDELAIALQKFVCLRPRFTRIPQHVYSHRWEKDGEVSRAACWLVFTKQYQKAIALLMKSSGKSLFELTVHE